MDFQDQDKRVYQKVAKKLNISEKLVEDIDKYYLHEISRMISEDEIIFGLNEEEFLSKYKRYSLPKLVTFVPNYKKYVERENFYNKTKEDKTVVQRDSDDS